jgi:hypothetical protein
VSGLLSFLTMGSRRALAARLPPDRSTRPAGHSHWRLRSSSDGRVADEPNGDPRATSLTDRKPLVNIESLSGGTAGLPARPPAATRYGRPTSKVGFVTASSPSPVVEEVLRFEDLPVGSLASRRAVVRWSDGSEGEGLRWYADEVLICEGDHGNSRLMFARAEMPSVAGTVRAPRDWPDPGGSVRPV